MDRFPTWKQKIAEAKRRAKARVARNESKKKIEKVREALRSAEVTRDLVDVSFDEILKALSDEFKVNIHCTAGAKVKAAGGQVHCEGRLPVR